MNPSADYLQNVIQISKQTPNKDRLDKRQNWHGMNGLDSTTAGYNINTRQELKGKGMATYNKY